jgi:predicted dehydrogenase
MHPKFNLAVIGAGYMGANHARVITDSRRARPAVIIDAGIERARRVAAQFDTKASSDLSAALECDAAVVASPTDTHVGTALKLIDAGIPLLIEKPIATDIDDVEMLARVARERRTRVMCGFVERFNPAVTTAQSLLEEPPIHMVAIRHSPAAPRIMNSVIHDLLIHDVDLALRIMPEDDVSDAFGTSWTPPGCPVPEIADCTLHFADGTIATLSSSRAGQRKQRLIQIGTPSTLLELDLLRLDITVYRHVRHEQNEDNTYRAETIIDIPFVRHGGEPLALQLERFLDLIEGKVDQLTELEGILTSHRVADRVARCCSETSPALRAFVEQ